MGAQTKGRYGVPVMYQLVLNFARTKLLADKILQARWDKQWYKSVRSPILPGNGLFLNALIGFESCRLRLCNGFSQFKEVRCGNSGSVCSCRPLIARRIFVTKVESNHSCYSQRSQTRLYWGESSPWQRTSITPANCSMPDKKGRMRCMPRSDFR